MCTVKTHTLESNINDYSSREGGEGWGRVKRGWTWGGGSGIDRGGGCYFNGALHRPAVH